VERVKLAFVASLNGTTIDNDLIFLHLHILKAATRKHEPQEAESFTAKEQLCSHHNAGSVTAEGG
jgi:hypothetical protein